MKASNQLTRLLLPLGLLAFSNLGFAADSGLITMQSRYSVRETIDRFEAAVKAKETNGFMVFTEIDHAAAGKKFGLNMWPRTVIVFGNPKLGTPVMQKTPTLAIDVPLKALIWQDDDGKVWLTYNSAEYLGGTIYVRHGLPDPPSTPALAKPWKSSAITPRNSPVFRERERHTEQRRGAFIGFLLSEQSRFSCGLKTVGDSKRLARCKTIATTSKNAAVHHEHDAPNRLSAVLRGSSPTVWRTTELWQGPRISRPWSSDLPIVAECTVGARRHHR